MIHMNLLSCPQEENSQNNAQEGWDKRDLDYYLSVEKEVHPYYQTGCSSKVLKEFLQTDLIILLVWENRLGYLSSEETIQIQFKEHLTLL